MNFNYIIVKLILIFEFFLISIIILSNCCNVLPSVVILPLPRTTSSLQERNKTEMQNRVQRAGTWVNVFFMSMIFCSRLILRLLIMLPPNETYGAHNTKRQSGQVENTWIEPFGTFIIQLVGSFGTKRAALCIHCRGGTCQHQHYQ